MIQNQNRKIWFFVEGASEEKFVLWLIRNFYISVILHKSEIEFFKAEDMACYITDCESGDKIPFAISDSGYKIKMAQCDIVVVCDLEKLPCVTKRKSYILDRIDTAEFDKAMVLFVFAKPHIEEIYCFEKIITEGILKLGLEHGGKGSPLQRMKTLHKKNNLTFKKVAFADKFFSQLDYKMSKNSTVQRLVTFVDERLAE